MTKVDWLEMKRRKMERQKKEQELKSMLGFAFQVTGAFGLLFVVAAVLG